MSAVSAFAQDSLQFNITAMKEGAPLEKKTLSVRTVPGSEGMFTNMQEEAAVNEVNSRYGKVELTPLTLHSGIFGKVRYKPTKEDNVVDMAVEYEWVEKNAVVSKGLHMVKAKVGETITLPGANGVELKLTVKS